MEDATLIRSLVDKNFQLEFRDDKSRLERADAELKAQIENGSGVCLGCDGEKPNERPFVVDVRGFVISCFEDVFWSYLFVSAV